MAIKLEDVKKFFEEMKDDEDVKQYLSALKAPAEVKKEDFEKYLVTEEGKALLKSKTDQACTNAINTFKEKTMPDLIKEAVDAKVKEINPDETPEQKKIREMNDKIDGLEKDKKREQLEKLVLQTLSNAKLSGFSSLMSFLVGDDEPGTIDNLKRFSEAITAYVEDKIKEALPGREARETNEENDPNFKNPFEKGTNFNLTEQGILYRKDPDLARRLQKQAAGS